LKRIESSAAALADITGLTLFCRDKPLIRVFKNLLERVLEKPSVGADELRYRLSIVEAWTSLLRTMIQSEYGDSFYTAVAFLTLTDDNVFTHRAEAQEWDSLSPLLAALAKNDIACLERIAQFDITSLGFYIAEQFHQAGLDYLAATIEAEARSLLAAKSLQNISEEVWNFLSILHENHDWVAALPEFAAYLRIHGAGELGRYHSFRWAGTNFLKPVRNPDTVRVADFTGYEDQRQVVNANTLRFLEGKPANNLLLYGDRGTGKSATVKAVCNEYARQGLRLLEVAKRDLLELPTILNILASRSLRFIIFIDDLSFESVDDSFTTLKMLLEGGIETKSSNVVVYATSNRRHLVKERLTDRPSTAAAADAMITGDMRAFDSMQEQFSLADRFGLTVVFTTPNQDEFLRIAEYIAVQRGILKASGTSEETLKRFRENALRWERWFNGRSPRTAVQFVDWFTGGDGFPWE
jgi:predicted AAA+ superfamily ATPase